jgi:hypothetical protein
MSADERDARDGDSTAYRPPVPARNALVWDRAYDGAFFQLECHPQELIDESADGAVTVESLPSPEVGFSFSGYVSVSNRKPGQLVLC